MANLPLHVLPNMTTLQAQNAFAYLLCTRVPSTVIRETFVVKNFLYSSRSTKIKHMKYFQHTYYIFKRELNYLRVQKFFNTNILHLNIS